MLYVRSKGLLGAEQDSNTWTSVISEAAVVGGHPCTYARRAA